MKQILHIPYCTGKMLQPNFDSTVCLRELSIVLLNHLTHSFNCCIIFLRMALLHFHNSGYLKCFPFFTITRTGVISMLPFYVLLFLQGALLPLTSWHQKILVILAQLSRVNKRTKQKIILYITFWL